jgi:hypothetical protein
MCFYVHEVIGEVVTLMRASYSGLIIAVCLVVMLRRESNQNTIRPTQRFLPSFCDPFRVRIVEMAKFDDMRSRDCHDASLRRIQ